MPSKAAQAAFLEMEEERKAQELSDDLTKELLITAEQRVKAVVGRGHIFDENAEDEVVKFGANGKSEVISLVINLSSKVLYVPLKVR